MSAMMKGAWSGRLGDSHSGKDLQQRQQQQQQQQQEW